MLCIMTIYYVMRSIQYLWYSVLWLQSDAMRWGHTFLTSNASRNRTLSTTGKWRIGMKYYIMITFLSSYSFHGVSQIILSNKISSDCFIMEEQLNKVVSEESFDYDLIEFWQWLGLHCFASLCTVKCLTDSKILYRFRINLSQQVTWTGNTPRQRTSIYKGKLISWCA